MVDRITYVGLDVHKEGIVVAVAAGGLRGEVREHGRIANTPTADASRIPVGAPSVRQQLAPAPLGGRTDPGLAQPQPPSGQGFRGIGRQCHRLDLHCFYATPRPAARIDTTIPILSQTLRAGIHL